VRVKLGDLRIWVCNFIVAYIPCHAFRLWFYRRIMRMEIGEGSSIHLGCRFVDSGKVKIGRNTTINQFCHLDNRGALTFGDNVSISPHTAIVTADHVIDSADFAGRIRPCTFEDYSFVGFRALILPGVTVGRGGVVCAGAVVTKDVAPMEIVGGSPARHLRQRECEPNYSASYIRFMH
jgi:maltose O-acetyltransferase